MKTKIFILIISMLVSFIYLDSFGIANQKHSYQLNQPTATSPVEHEKPAQQMDWMLNWASNSGQTDHVRECHNFHFDRFCKSRRRIILLFVIKLWLSVLHISIFLCTCIHLLH